MSGNGHAAEVLALVRRWAEAEQHNDAGLLGGLLADDFVGVGPLGFVLARDQWLGRFQGGLENRGFAERDPQVHNHGGAAVVVGSWTRRRAGRGATTRGGSGSRSSPCAGRIAGCSPARTSAAAGAGPRGAGEVRRMRVSIGV